jgi:hypothetical protein
VRDIFMNRENNDDKSGRHRVMVYVFITVVAKLLPFYWSRTQITLTSRSWPPYPMEKFLLLVSGLVKRDTAADIENSLKNVFGSNDNPLEDLQVGAHCAGAKHCKENPTYVFLSWE